MIKKKSSTSKTKAKGSTKRKKSSKNRKKSKVEVSSLFSGIKVLKYTDPVEVYGCTPFSDSGGSCATCLGSYTC